ncbi:chorismate mutase [Streptomyces sp. NPDC101115]|uniref:chorismate mutase n=1 Tax=Streptomyces sp. NPDC101115 TaxID=3366106 RepID=UPI0037FE2CBA
MSEIDESVRAELTRLRESIDNIDAAVVHMLAERFKCTQQVGVLKAKHQLPPADPAREARQIARLRELAESAKLDPAFAEKLLNFIIAEVIRHHETIADETIADGTAADGAAADRPVADGTAATTDRTIADGAR